MDLYFVDKLAATIRLVDGKLVVTGPKAKSVASTLRGYSRMHGGDAAVYEKLPRLFRGYWHVDEDA